MQRLISSVLLLLTLGCKDPNLERDLHHYKFDTTITNRLLLYDSLRQKILNNYQRLSLSNEKNNFTYIFNSDSLTTAKRDNDNTLPADIYLDIAPLLTSIGAENIFGFTISEDSSFEILIRNTHIQKHFLDVRERLYWYSQATKIEKPSFPIKDTLLDNNWQYIIWFDKRSKF